MDRFVELFLEAVREIVAVGKTKCYEEQVELKMLIFPNNRSRCMDIIMSNKAYTLAPCKHRVVVEKTLDEKYVATFYIDHKLATETFVDNGVDLIKIILQHVQLTDGIMLPTRTDESLKKFEDMVRMVSVEYVDHIMNKFLVKIVAEDKRAPISFNVQSDFSPLPW